MNPESDESEQNCKEELEWSLTYCEVARSPDKPGTTSLLNDLMLLSLTSQPKKNLWLKTRHELLSKSDTLVTHYFTL